MMLKPSIDKLLDKVPSKYSLVILQAKRAHELAAGAEPTQEFTSVKPTLQALEEIESGNVTIHPDPESKRELARLKVIQARLAAEEEERKIKDQYLSSSRKAELLIIIIKKEAETLCLSSPSPHKPKHDFDFRFYRLLLFL